MAKCRKDRNNSLHLFCCSILGVCHILVFLAVGSNRSILQSLETGSIRNLGEGEWPELAKDGTSGPFTHS